MSTRAAMLLGLALVCSTAAGREPGDPIRLVSVEGDVAGLTRILSADGREEIGLVAYRQTREGDVLHALRAARFRDGSSDVDEVVARVGETLRTLRGRSTIRDSEGRIVADLTIDVGGGRIDGVSVERGERTVHRLDVDLPPGTYFGPLIFLVVKNFDANAVDGRVVFRTVAPTPAPRVIDLALELRDGDVVVQRVGTTFDASELVLQPTIHWLVDPLVRRLVPATRFYVEPGSPPALVRYLGPRNFAGQTICIE